jgi:hypothetical protein
MEMFITTHENFVYDELVDEMVEICRIRNAYENDLFRRFMQIYCRFHGSDEPSGQEIFDWFSNLISISKECDFNDQTISHSQDLNLTMKDRGYIISNPHSDTNMTESLSEIFDPLSP